MNVAGYIMFRSLWIWVTICCLSVRSQERYCYNSSLLPSTVTPHELFTEDLDIHKMLQLIPPFASIAPGVSDLCLSESKAFLSALAELQLWALQMHDATAKVGSGLLNGNTVLLGDLDQCLTVDSGVVRGQYCLSTIHLEPVLSPRPSLKRQAVHHMLQLMQSHNAFRSVHADDMQIMPLINPLTWAACVPASCSERDVETALRYVLQPFNVSSGVELHVKVRPGACVTETDTPMDLYAVGTAAFLMTVFLLAVWGTFHERVYTAHNGELSPTATEGTWRRVLLAFSFSKNMRALLDTSGPKDELSCVHGIRAMVSLVVYLLHHYFFYMFYPLTNRTQMTQLMEGDWTMAFRVILNWVDTFVVLSGLLTSFYAVKKLQEGRKINIARMYLQRYVKFTPMLFATVLVTQNLLEHVIAAPQRIRIVGHYIQKCKRGLLPVVTYTNTFQGFENMCYPPSHQLATEMHMYLLAPFLLLAAWKWPQRAPACLGALLAGLAALKYYVVRSQNLSPFLFYGISEQQLVDTANYSYMNAVHRLTPYLCGLALGYLLRVRACKSSLTRVQMTMGTTAALAAAYYSFYGVAHAARRDFQYDAAEAAAFAVVQPLFWSFALSWLVFCCATGQAPGWLRNALSWRGFVVFSRLSYAFYLVQILVIAVNVGNALNAEYFRTTKLIDLNEISALLLLSLVWTLLFLLPLQDLWNIAAGTYTVPSKVKASLVEVSKSAAPHMTLTTSD